MDVDELFKERDLLTIALVYHVVKEQVHNLAECHLFVVMRVDYLEHAILLTGVLRPI